MLTPYNQDFVEMFKTVIPYPHRKWNPEKKQWLVAETMLQETVELMKLYFDDITQALVSDEPANVWEIALEHIPNEYLDRVYMALANGLHPDHGGNAEEMKKLNIAYGSRKERR